VSCASLRNKFCQNPNYLALEGRLCNPRKQEVRGKKSATGAPDFTVNLPEGRIKVFRIPRHSGLVTAAMLGIVLAASPAIAFQEAPMLAEQVQAGTLPPVDERLPENPVVVPVVESIGQYGGVFSMHILGGTDRGYGWLEREIGYERLMRWAPEGGRAIPNIAESVDVSEDSTTYTFHLRQGIRWSDGEPLTSDDY